MRRCVIHIGHPKTASTFLQHAMHDNQAALLRHGWWVPAEFTAVGYYDLTALSAARVAISGNLAPAHEMMALQQQDRMGPMWEALFGAQVPDGANLLLSSELFFYYPFATAAVVNHAQRFGFAAEVLAYVPRQDEGAIAGYLQNVRNHEFAAGLTEFLLHDPRMQYCKYLRAVTRLAEAVPNTPIQLRSFAPAFLTDGDILADLLGLIGVPVAALVRPRVASNQGLLLEQYELLRAASLLQRSDAAEHLRNDADNDTVPASERARVRAFYYRPHVQQFLQERYFVDNAALLERFMPHVGAAERDWWMHCPEAVAQPRIDAVLLQTLRREAFGG